ncbi:MAG: ABC transporter permease [Spirochaetales bacterium]|nr:ABC transporter permease [Candidatus Physcosoma equi]
MFFENLKLAFKSMFANKMRTFLSLLGIVIGVGSVVTIMNLGESVKKAISNEMNIGGVDLITVSPRSTAKANFDEEFALSFLDNVEGIDAVASAVSSSAMLRFNQETTSASIYGTTANYFSIQDMDILYGRFFTTEENLQRKQVIVLGYNLAEDLFPGGDAIGQYVSVFRTQSKKYLVVGVLADSGDSLLSNTNNMAYIPYNTFDSRFRSVKNVSSYYLKVNENYVATDVSHSVKAYMATMASSSDYSVSAAAELVNMADSVTGYLTTFLAAIAAISLIVGGIGIMNIMLVTVVERTKEIGIRKALGATPKTIKHQFLVEATVLSIFGGGIGLVFGSVVSYVVAQAAGWTLYFSLNAVLLSFGFSSAVGIFFGWYPAAQAAALDPIQALAYE